MNVGHLAIAPERLWRVKIIAKTMNRSSTRPLRAIGKSHLCLAADEATRLMEVDVEDRQADLGITNPTLWLVNSILGKREIAYFFPLTSTDRCIWCEMGPWRSFRLSELNQRLARRRQLARER